MTTIDQTHDDPPVTVSISRRVKAGREAEFEAFMSGLGSAAARFPGYLGANVFRPSLPGDNTYRVIFKFDHNSNLRRWEESEERKRWLACAADLIEGEEEEVITGLETWFTLPGQPVITPPPRYKMLAISWLAVYPLATVLFFILGAVLGDAPIALRTLLFSLIMLTLMTYLVMPQMTRLFAWWLYPKSAPQRTVPPTED